MRKFILLSFIVLLFSPSYAQSESVGQPKLVIGITVDQMRQEYLYRYYSKFGQGGFKRLMDQGFMLENAHFNYIPTVTGAGHASVFTGTTPAVHGIIGNSWYDKSLEREVYCVGDENYKTVGSTTVSKGKTSPQRLLTNTITDELKIATQKRAKVIGLSIKDRGAVLPVGHMANAAYWYDGTTGRFVTSTYYVDKLPDWMERFNNLQLADKYLSGSWYTLHPIGLYEESGPDSSPYEGTFNGETKSTFPYILKDLRKTNGDFELLSHTPFSNDHLTELAKASIEGEKLGADEWTDLLSISYSAPDIIGHQFGPQSIEVQDVYLRLDKNLEDLFRYLDQNIGAGKYLVFLTADHAVAEVPQYLIDNKAPAGNLRSSQIMAEMGTFLNSYFPDRKIVKALSNSQLFFNHEAFGSEPKIGGVDLLVATELISNFLMQKDGIANVFSKNLLRSGNFSEGGIKGMAIRGHHPKRSGDITIVHEPGWFEGGGTQGTTHGSPYVYDTHVPVLFYGFGVKQGSSVQYHSITDIAPTLSILLKIQFPNGCTGQPIGELFD